MTRLTINLEVTYDQDADAAYISLNQFGGGWASSVNLDPTEIDGIVVVDLDDEQRILGIEIQGAAGKLPQDLFELLRGRTSS